MKTSFQQIVDTRQIASLDNREPIDGILTLAKAETSLPATNDKRRTLLLAIDIQNDFMEDIGSLAVKGSRADVQRLTEWMYTNLAGLTQVICSLDCHSIRQVFHADWWVNPEGEHPAPFTIISYEDVLSGKWIVTNGETELSLDYLRNLEKDNKKQLCIWPYHCLEGTFGAQLEGEFTKMLYFHAAVRQSKPILVHKGQNPYSEMYGIIKAEYDPTGYVNQPVLDAIAEYDAIFLAGEASSHCVLASLEQILEYYKDDKSITSRITLLEDCMSPIAGFEDSTVARFDELKNKYGINICKSTAIKL